MSRLACASEAEIEALIAAMRGIPDHAIKSIGSWANDRWVKANRDHMRLPADRPMSTPTPRSDQ